MDYYIEIIDQVENAKTFNSSDFIKVTDAVYEIEDTVNRRTTFLGMRIKKSSISNRIKDTIHLKYVVDIDKDDAWGKVISYFKVNGFKECYSLPYGGV